VNLFTLADAGVSPLMAACGKDDAWMARQPGCLSTRLRETIGGRRALMNRVPWNSVDDVRAALAHPDFVRALEAEPSSAVAQPRLFARIAVRKLCAA
jgi:hypothetical protein